MRGGGRGSGRPEIFLRRGHTAGEKIIRLRAQSISVYPFPLEIRVQRPSKKRTFSPQGSSIPPGAD